MGSATRLAELSVRAFEVGAQDWGACCVRWGIAIPADAEQGALGVRVRGRGRTRSTIRLPNPSLRDGWPLPLWPLLGGALTGGAVANLGAPRAPCDPVGQISEAVSFGQGRWWLSLGRLLR